jgi:hypothetical protein
VKIRFTSVSEYQMLICLKHKLWGSNQNRFRTWELGDLLIIRVDYQVACVVKISGAYFRSDTLIWNNGVFPWRIPIELFIYYSIDNRDRISMFTENLLMSAFGSKYGLSIQSQKPLPFIYATKLYDYLRLDGVQDKQILSKRHLNKLIIEFTKQ